MGVALQNAITPVFEINNKAIRVHPAPGVGTIWLPGAHISIHVHPVSAPYFRFISIHYIGLNTIKLCRVQDFESLCTRCLFSNTTPIITTLYVRVGASMSVYRYLWENERKGQYINNCRISYKTSIMQVH